MLITRREFGRIALSSGLFVLLSGDAFAGAQKKDGKKNQKHPRVHSTSGRQHEDHHDPKKPIVHNWYHINQGQPMPNGGAGLQISPNGHWQFTGHLFNPNAMPCVICLMFGVKSSTGTLYTFQTYGTVTGSFGNGNQFYQWDKSGHSDRLKNAWNDLTKAHDWACESLMQLQQLSFGGISGGSGVNPEALLSMVENRLNAVGPVVAICQ